MFPLPIRPLAGRAFGLAAVLLLAVPSAAHDVKKVPLTHLGVVPSRVVNIRTFDLPPDNDPHPFFYDRTTPQFSVPAGYSFVVTDVVVEPSVAVPAPDQHVLLVVNLGPVGSRTFDVNYLGGETRHFSFAGGIVMQEGLAPSARSTGFSNVDCEVQILGYFVKAPALPEGQPAFPTPVE